MWRSQAVLVLTSYGFLKEFRPSEPFLTSYLVGPSKNFTQEEVYQEIYPIGTYSTVFLVVIVFLLTDVLCYKPIVLVQGLAGITCYCLLIFGANIPSLQVCEVFYGLFIASDVAYSTYIYATCEKDEYRKLTSYTRMALLCGRFFSALIGEFLVSFSLFGYNELNFITLSSVSVATFTALLLPPTPRSLYFHPMETPKNSEGETQINSKDLNISNSNEEAQCYHRDASSMLSGNISSDVCSDRRKMSSTLVHISNDCVSRANHRTGLALILLDFHSSYSDFYVFQWSLWWALTHCGYLQVSSYIQNLWQYTVEISGGRLFNGVASATYAITGILATWAVGQIQVKLEKCTLWLLAVCALIAGSLVTWSALTNSLLLQYIFFGIFKVLYQVMMTFANSEVAKSLSQDSYGLVFGFNTFVALLLQTTLTAVVVGKGGLQFSIGTQFLTYGLYFCVIGVGFGAVAFFNSIQTCHKPQHGNVSG